MLLTLITQTKMKCPCKSKTVWGVQFFRLLVLLYDVVPGKSESSCWFHICRTWRNVHSWTTADCSPGIPSASPLSWPLLHLGAVGDCKPCPCCSPESQLHTQSPPQSPHECWPFSRSRPESAGCWSPSWRWHFHQLRKWAGCQEWGEPHGCCPDRPQNVWRTFGKPPRDLPA